jgi:hypothetical protein
MVAWLGAGSTKYATVKGRRSLGAVLLYVYTKHKKYNIMRIFSRNTTKSTYSTMLKRGLAKGGISHSAIYTYFIYNKLYAGYIWPGEEFGGLRML